MTNRLYYGDNLDVLRASVADASVDLVYLDPPFNSAATYNVLFKAPDGVDSASQIEAFEDTWRWGESAERAFHDVLTSGHTGAAVLLKAMRTALSENDMMAYHHRTRLILVQGVGQPSAGGWPQPTDRSDAPAPRPVSSCRWKSEESGLPSDAHATADETCRDACRS